VVLKGFFSQRGQSKQESQKYHFGGIFPVTLSIWPVQLAGQLAQAMVPGRIFDPKFQVQSQNLRSKLGTQSHVGGIELHLTWGLMLISTLSFDLT
jgi:hypothetical protein